MSDSASQRILMVEDEEDIAFLIRFMLERHGFVVDHAADGRQAIEKITTSSPPDLTLMDIMLPYHDGLELIERLRAQAGWAQVPVLMLTARGQTKDRETAKALGVSRFMTKPFSNAEVLESVRSLANGVEAPQ